MFRQTYTRDEVRDILATLNGKPRRFHAIDVRAGIYADTAPIAQRSLKSVGGIRADAKGTRKKNRKAREAGFNSFAHQVARMAALHAAALKHGA